MMSNGVAPPAPKDGRGQYTPIPTDPQSPAVGEPQAPTQKADATALLNEVQRRAESEKSPSMRCIESTAFQCFGATLIVSNAIVIGLETDLGGWEHWDIVENLFLFLFLFELLMRMCIIGPISFFFRHEDVPWNFFDFFIVSLGVFDYVMALLGHAKGAGSFATIFRMIRLLRILRIFRVLKFLKQLYVLAFGLVEAVKAVFWVTILMVFMLYVCSIVLVKTVGRPSEDDPYYDFMAYRFGHILDSMLTLFILMSSPNLPTYEDQEGLLQSHPVLTIFLCGFIIFGSFGIIALLTGVISESMFEKNEVRKEQVRQEHEEMRKSLGQRCEQLFLSLGDFDENGEARVENVKVLTNEMWQILENAGAEVTHSDVSRIVDFMDVNGTGLIGTTEFRATMEKIAEGLSTMGVQEVANRVGLCETKIDKVQEIAEVLGKQTEELENGLKQILASLGSKPNAYR